MSARSLHSATLPLPLLAVCFFGSGLTGLIYEVVWFRRLQLTFGCTTYSLTTVLAAFMAGLGIGSFLFGRRVDRGRAGGVRVYAWLELGVGLFALLSLPLLGLTERLYVVLQSWLELGQAGAALLKLCLAFPVLALPAAMMGGTLPALVRGLLRRREGLQSLVGWLYGVNTAGAALGAGLAGMLLIEYLGLWRSVALAAAINLGIGLLLLTLLRLRRVGPPSAAEPAPAATDLRRHLRSAPVLFCVVALAFTGGLSMLYQVVWTRMLTLVLGSSTYAFTIVLSIFLVGLALGALAHGRLSRGRPARVPALVLLLLGLALWAAATLALVPRMPTLLLLLRQLPEVGFFWMLAFEALLALCLLLVPTLLLGAALPMAIGIIGRQLGQAGEDVGGAYLVNTLGAIAGALLTGFLLLPLLGSQAALAAGLLANLALVLAGSLLFGGGRWRRALTAAVALGLGAAAICQPPWPAEVFDAGLGHRQLGAPAADWQALQRRLRRSPSKLLFRQEGINATITVRQNPAGLTLYVNGKADASSDIDMRTQVLLGVVPMLAHPRPRQVAIVGWGSGVTAHTATLFGGVRRVEVMEIEPAVVQASPHFAAFNGGAERHPKVQLVYDDARSHLAASPRLHDVIISEPSNPWMAGVSALFSREFYQLVRRRLTADGVFGQWLQLYHLDAPSVALVIRTLMDSFPHVQLWLADGGNVILLASARPIRHSYQRTRRAYRAERRLGLQMGAHGPGPEPGHFFGAFLLDRPGLERVLKKFKPEVLTDDHPVLEYRAVRSLYRPVQAHSAQLLQARLALGSTLPTLAGDPPPPGLALAGSARMIRDIAPGLRAPLIARGMQRLGDLPALRLARAEALLDAGRTGEARMVLEPLHASTGQRAEVALLEARLLLREGNGPQALEPVLKRGGVLASTRARWLLLQAAAGAGRARPPWTTAKKLLDRLDDRLDPGILELSVSDLYRQIHRLVQRTRDYGQGLRLLSRRQERHGGEVSRLRALLEVARVAGDARRAAAAREQLKLFGVIEAPRQQPRGRRLWP